ncbi:MAG TPA: hypothetical protein VFU16_07060 [Solirubrobacterales bacterium]|nr:hypothetical protein [Solirubrobacterales bacterium]
MSESESLKETLQEIVAGLENVSLQLEATEPRRRRALTGLVREANEALARLDEHEHHWHTPEGPGVYEPDPEVRTEGEFVAEQLRRLGDPGDDSQAYKDREPYLAPSGLELLAAALHPQPHPRPHEPETEAS